MISGAGSSRATNCATTTEHHLGLFLDKKKICNDSPVGLDYRTKEQKYHYFLRMTTNSPFFVQISDIFVRLLGEWPCRHRGSHLDVWPCQNDSFILDPEKVICSTIDDIIKIMKKVKKVTVTLGRIFSFKKLL